MLTNFGIGTLVNFSPQYVAAHACTLAQDGRSIKANDAAKPARSAAPLDGACDHPAARCGMWTRVATIGCSRRARKKTKKQTRIREDVHANDAPTAKAA